MATSFKKFASWSWRGAALLSLVLGLLAFQTAFADNTAAITLFAPGATEAAPVVVQFQNPSGQWITVTGWQGTLDKTNLDVPTKTWTVYEENFGQGPFRWVVYQADGKTVWATSDIFNLPSGKGSNRSETIRANNLASAALKTAVGEVAQAPTLSAGQYVTQSDVAPGEEQHGHITAYINGMPATSWIGVQWMDALGNWHLVDGWQGTAQSLLINDALKTWTPDGSGVLFQQWAVMPDLQGQGPFRWAIFSGPNGALLGVSPTFLLPGSGLNSITYLTK